jgi:tetratricopeptide (TPR) repeat protein
VALQRAWIKALRGDYGGAVAAARQALASEPELAGQPSALGAQDNIAWWLSLAGDSAGGLEVFRELEGPEAAADLVRNLVPALVAEIGPTMGPSLTNRKNLVHWLMESGRASEAEAACREAVADLDTYGSLPLEAADDLRITLAEFDYRAGRPAEEMARALDTLSVPLNDPNALQVRSNLAYCLWQDGRPSEALAVYRELLQDLPAGHPLRTQTIQSIATLSDR